MQIADEPVPPCTSCCCNSTGHIAPRLCHTACTAAAGIDRSSSLWEDGGVTINLFRSCSACTWTVTTALALGCMTRFHLQATSTGSCEGSSLGRLRMLQLCSPHHPAVGPGTTWMLFAELLLEVLLSHSRFQSSDGEVTAPNSSVGALELWTVQLSHHPTVGS